MGSTVNLSCACGLTGKGVAVGMSALPTEVGFEHRVFFCSACETLSSARVLRRVADLRASLADMEKRGSSWTVGVPELIKQLIASKAFPHCDCGAPLRGSAASGEEGTRCPRCGDALSVELTANWD